MYDSKQLLNRGLTTNSNTEALHSPLARSQVRGPLQDASPVTFSSPSYEQYSLDPIERTFALQSFSCVEAPGIKYACRYALDNSFHSHVSTLKPHHAPTH